ncbi:NIPSNAP family protein [Dinoroseobacter shibae]|nr:NIPSNAP family protein [Dinoroseobacter shibae]URF47304.1 NIPSNAP family protein [Dinoroseobacter shibae]
MACKEVCAGSVHAPITRFRAAISKYALLLVFGTSVSPFEKLFVFPTKPENTALLYQNLIALLITLFGGLGWARRWHMIVEQRRYTLKTGKVPEYLQQYEKEGFAIQQPILGRLVGYFSTEIGTLHQIVHLWAYRDLADRDARRARLGADQRWLSYLAKVQPLQIAQNNEILKPASFCPDYLSESDA